ncbi:hypothetical protein VPH35_025448 [Triticum aestivum]
MSSSSSSSLPVPADWLLPLMACPLCSDEVVTAVARTGNQAGHRFYKCIRYDISRIISSLNWIWICFRHRLMCCFFEFQRAYCRRMTHEQILAAQHQAGWHPGGHGFAVQHGNGAAQIVPAALQPQAQQHIQPLQPQIQAPVQPPPPPANHLIADAFRPVVAAAASPGAQGLAAVAVLMAAINIMLTVLVLMVVLAMYFA